MKYEKVTYSRSKIEKAGRIIANFADNTGEYSEYISVVDNWRAAHTAPLDGVYAIIKNSMSNKQGVKVVSRLKRLESIIGKLQRKNNTGLYRMQDLGGCRIIVPDIKNINSIIDEIKSAIVSNGHEIYKEDDYIAKPRKESGYRSYHMVVKYHDETDCYNGMFIEIQIRTALQHYWATAVEIMDATANETLKVGTGKKEYMYFFKLVSGLFSIAENTKIVEEIPIDKQRIVFEIYRIDRSESIREKLSAYKSAISFTGFYPDEADYYLLQTDMRKSTISAKSYHSEDLDLAMRNYLKIESKKNINHIDVVLVAAKNFETIRDYYPNYFRDASLFLLKINEYCAEFPEKSSILFSTKSKGAKISDYFSVIENNDVTPEVYDIEDGIGATSGTLIICPAWPITHDESYMRFSGIVCKDVEMVKANKNIRTKKIVGPGIIILSTGACFIVEKDCWEYISATTSIVLQCKENVKKEWLTFLIGWIKSNVFTADLLCNRSLHSIYAHNKYYPLDIPLLEDVSFSETCKIVEKIIHDENVFVSEFYNIEETRQIEAINSFNKKIDSYLCQNERIFYDYYSLGAEDIKLIKKELQLKGYYVYGTLCS